MRVDSDDIISIGDDLIEQYPDTFSDDFEANKRQVEELTTLRSKYVRNRVAGYVTRKRQSNAAAEHV